MRLNYGATQLLKPTLGLNQPKQMPQVCPQPFLEREPAQFYNWFQTMQIMSTRAMVRGINPRITMAHLMVRSATANNDSDDTK